LQFPSNAKRDAAFVEANNGAAIPALVYLRAIMPASTSSM
jgi:hypothetical protein